MNHEIEVKYLIWEDGKSYASNELFKIFPEIRTMRDKIIKFGTHIQQGYLPKKEGEELIDLLNLNVDFEPEEIRLRKRNDELYQLTLKSDGNLVRNEFETTIKKEIFDRYWPLTEGKRIEKKRLVIIGWKKYDVAIDVYLDRDLIIAEIELPKKEIKIESLGKDITKDDRYKNRNLAK